MNIRRTAVLVSTLVLAVILGILFRSNIISIWSPRDDKRILYDQIMKECSSSDSAISAAVWESVEMTVKCAVKNVAIVEVKAPDISKELYDYVDSMDDITEGGLEEQILKCLQETEKQTKEFKLSYENTGGKVRIQYTPEYAEFISCGLLSFYGRVMDEVLSEMEGMK